MGSRNVRAALAVDKISDRAGRVLVAMALVSLDHDSKRSPARTYFAGREALAAMLGWFPDATAVRKIDRALTELVAAGLVERLVDKPAPGQRQTYRLHLQPVDNSPDDDP